MNTLSIALYARRIDEINKQNIVGFEIPAPQPHGLAPRMWGTQYADSKARCNCRFSPTHVGNTSPNTISSMNSPV